MTARPTFTDDDPDHARVWAACVDLYGKCSCAAVGGRCCESLEEVVQNSTDAAKSEKRRIVETIADLGDDEELPSDFWID